MVVGRINEICKKGRIKNGIISPFCKINGLILVSKKGKKSIARQPVFIFIIKTDKLIVIL